MTFNFLGPGLTVNVEAKVKEQIILDSSDLQFFFHFLFVPKSRFGSLYFLFAFYLPCILPLHLFTEHLITKPLFLSLRPIFLRRLNS